MTSIIAILVALVGAAVQSRRNSADPAEGWTTVDRFLVWWLAVAIGVSSLIVAGAHLFFGAATAESIGYTRGDGGFQFENAMADLSIGVVGVLCIWFRGNFWLATLIVVTVQYIGDAGGHIYFWLAEDNTKSGNIGPPLWSDIIQPTVGWVLFALSFRRNGFARNSTAVSP